MADHLLQEVDADLRAERIHQLWQRHRKHLLLAIAALLIVTAGNSLWQNYREKKGGELLLALTDAQALYEQGKFTEAADGFAATAKRARGDSKTLAQLWQGRALVRAGKRPEGVAVLKEASTSRNLWGDLACLRVASLDLTAADCLTDDRDSPLAGKRHEWHAAKAWSEGKHDEATAALEEIATSRDTPDASREMITQWLATLRVDAKPAAEKPAEEKTEEAPTE